MRIYFRYTILAASTLLISLASAAAAPVPTIDDFPQQGILTAQGSIPAGGSIAIPQLPMGLDGRPVPLVGGLSRTKSGWECSVTNQTDTPIKMSAQLVQYDPTLKRLTESSINFKLPPKGTEKTSVAIDRRATGAAMHLKSWKRQ